MTREGRSVCVGASAGSGKTTRLVGEYFEHIANGAHVSSILALTFNDEAAASMRERIRKRTLEISNQDLYDMLNWAQVQTFHSFCAQLLREFHLRAGVPSDFMVVEELDMNVMLQESWEELLSADDDGLRRTFVKVCSPLSHRRVRSMMVFLYGRRARAIAAMRNMEDPTVFRRVFSEMVQRRLDSLDAYLFDDEMERAVNELLRLSEVHAEEDGDQAGRYLFNARTHLLSILSGDRDARLLAFQSLGDIKGSRNMGNAKKLKGDKEALTQAYGLIKRRLEDAKEELHHLRFDLDPRSLEAAVEHLLGLRQLFLRFASIVDAKKAERRCLDFDDLLIRAQELLRDDGENPVLEALRERYEHILVDEYQDTDLPQDRIVRALVGDHPGKLFVVGDGKQSIYLFRGADVSIFKGMLRYVECELKGRREELGNNYRSAPEIVAFVNALFSRIMNAEVNDWEFKYLKVSPSRVDDQGSVTVVQVPCSENNEKLSMARAVADQISRLVQGDGRMVYCGRSGPKEPPRAPRFGDITILLRARTNLRYYESVLAERGIPYAVEKGVGFFQRQEVMDIGNLVRFLANRMDDISLYGLLRSPFFGLSDALLFRIARSANNGSLFYKLTRYCGAHPDEIVARKACDTLNSLLQMFGTVTVSELLNAALRETGVLGVLAGMPDGRQAVANVERLLDMIRVKEQEGFFTLHDLREWLELSEEGSDKQGQAPLEDVGDAVRIMTVHASKGLEFPIVLVPEAHSSPRDDADEVAITDEGLFAEAPSADPMETYGPAPMRSAMEVLRAKSEAENLRLFYVAATRAKDHLIIFGCRKRKGGDWAGPAEGDRNWFALTMNSLGLSSVVDGSIEIDGDEAAVLRMETFEEEEGESIFEVQELRALPEWAKEWSFKEQDMSVGQIKVVLPSAIDSKVEEKFQGSRWSPLKALLISKGLNPASYGTLVHEVLMGRSPERLLSALNLELDDHERKVVIDGLEGVRERFSSSDLMKARSKGGMDLCELPFELREGNTLYIGAMDRLVEMEDGGWALIDYKTVSHGADLEEVRSAFQGQVQVYERAATELIGMKPRCYLYLTESGTMLRMC